MICGSQYQSATAVATETRAVKAFKAVSRSYSGTQNVNASRMWVLPQKKMNSANRTNAEGKAISRRFPTK